MSIQTRIVSTGLEGTYPLRYGPSAMPTGTAAMVYEATDRSAVRQMTFTNTTSGNLHVTVHILSATGSVSIGNQLISNMEVPPYDSVPQPVAFVMNKGDRVFALADGAVNLMFNVYDREPGWL